MKIVLFGDLHIFNHFGKTQFEDIAQTFLIDLFERCKKEKIKKIIFLGDFFHIKNKLYVPPFIKSIDILRDMKKAKIEIIFLIGNHDAPQMGTTDHSIMYAFQEYGTVIPLYEWEDIDDLRLHYLSFTNELPKFEMNDKANILLGHLDIQSFMMDTGFICKEGFDSSSFKKFDYVFSGHFHRHQIKKNITYVGSPYQIRFSERFDDKGYVILDTKSLNWSFEIYDKAPRFKELDIENLDEEDVKGNFARIKTHKNNQNLSEIKDKLLNMGALSVDFIFIDENEDKELHVIENLSLGEINELASSYWDNYLESDLFDKSMKELIDKKKIEKKDFMGIFTEIEEAHQSGWKSEESD